MKIAIVFAHGLASFGGTGWDEESLKCAMT